MMINRRIKIEGSRRLKVMRTTSVNSWVEKMKRKARKIKKESIRTEIKRGVRKVKIKRIIRIDEVRRRATITRA